MNNSRRFSEILIPQLAIFEQQVFNLAAQKGVLKECTDEILESFGGKAGDIPVGPYKQTRVLGMLYILCVFSYEFWKKKGQIEAIKNHIKSQVEKNLNKLNVVNVDPALLLSKMRNSVAHSHLRFDGDRLQMWDVNGNGNRPFDVCLDIDQWMEILNVFSSVYIEWGNKPEFAAVQQLN